MKLSYLKIEILNNIFIITFTLILFLLSINYYFIFILYTIYLIYIYKQSKIIFMTSIILSLIVLIIFIFIKSYYNYLINDEKLDILIKGKIIDIDRKTNYQKITIKYKLFKVIILDYDLLEYKIGQVIEVQGIKSFIESNHIPNAFNYKKYLNNNLYLYQITNTNIKILKEEISIYTLNSIINNYLNNNFKNDSLILLKGFILGDTSEFSDELNENLRINGIIHLFAISGSHITLIISFLEKVINKHKDKNKIINILLGLYLVITKFSVSIFRAILTFYLNQYFIYKKQQISSLDISSITFIILIILNPFYMYNLGFILSFFSTFIIILLKNYLNKLSNIKSLLMITIFINLFTFPIIININNEFNLLSPIINIIMIFIVEGIIIPLSFIVAVLPILNIGYTYIISGFISLNDIIADISYKSGLVIIIGNLSTPLMIAYYFIIFLIIIFLLKPRVLRYMYLLYFTFLILLFLNIKITNTIIITFLDLYNGESTLIEYKNEIILIDTGEGYNNELTNFLKSKGIRKINYLILTHNHSDHNGEANKILNTFSVTHIVINEYDNSEFSKYNKTIKLNKGDILKTKYLEFYCLSPYQYSNNENNNSLVLYVKMNNYYFLFTGDIETEVENKLPNLKVDVIKVAHHGSNTSSSINFIYKMKPTYAIIMNGRKNINTFPNKEVISNFKQNNTKIYCTKYNYTITLKIKNNKCIFYPLKEIIN